MLLIAIVHLDAYAAQKQRWDASMNVHEHKCKLGEIASELK